MSTEAVVTVDCKNVIEDLKHIWTSISFDEINWSYTERGKDLLRTLKNEVFQRPYYVRNHNAFTSGNCLSSPAHGSTNVYVEDEQKNPIYNFNIIDQLYDNYIENNLIPFVEFNFMPFDLVPNQSAQQDYDLNGWKYPPKDYKKWISLIQTFLKHLDERYGKQIENWYFEVWNEPNILNYWLGTVEDYCHLYDSSVQALKSINPNLKIGGPALATNGSSGDFLEKFLEHITNAEIPIDFISFHIKGAYFSPLRSYGHKVELEYPSISRIITDIQTNLNIINQFPNLNNVSIFIDECDPTVGAIYGVYDNPNFVVCNTEYYPSVIAEMIYTILSISPRIHLICNSLFYMEGKRLFEGNRTFVTNYNLHLPVMNGFKLFEKLQTKQFSIEIKDNHIPLHGISTFHEANSDIQLLLFSHIDDYTLYENQNVTIIFNNMKLNYVLVRHYKIDANNNNIYSEWVKFGKPDYLNSDQLKYFQNFQELKLFDKPIVYQVENNQLILNGFNIYTHSTDFIEIINLDVSSSQ